MQSRLKGVGVGLDGHAVEPRDGREMRLWWRPELASESFDWPQRVKWVYPYTLKRQKRQLP